MEVDFDELKVFVKNHPAKAVLGTGIDDQARTDNALRFCSTVARDFPSPRVGLLSKPQGAGAFGYSSDNITVRMDSGAVLHFDIVQANESAEAKPSWQPNGGVSPDRWRPFDPRYVVDGSAKPEEPEDPPGPPQDLTELTASVDGLSLKVETLTLQVAQLNDAILALADAKAGAWPTYAGSLRFIGPFTMHPVAPEVT